LNSVLQADGLDYAQVEKQIEQMVRFIKQEADEKANEIRVSAEEVQPGM
jgi:V-type H+-transporting ATPase subunit E